MDDKLETYFHCGGPLIEIDHYGERLVGCIECNRWTWSRSGQLMTELPKEDLEALRACDGAMGTDSILDEGEAESSTCQRAR
jgi:hypothetical protein